MQLETAHLSGAAHFNEAFAARCRPLLLHPDASPPVMLRAKPVGPAVPEKLPGAFFQHGKNDWSQGNRLG